MIDDYGIIDRLGKKQHPGGFYFKKGGFI